MLENRDELPPSNFEELCKDLGGTVDERRWRGGDDEGAFMETCSVGLRGGGEARIWQEYVSEAFPGGGNLLQIEIAPDPETRITDGSARVNLGHKAEVSGTKIKGTDGEITLNFPIDK